MSIQRGLNITLAAVLLAVGTMSSAFAVPIVLDFEGVGDLASVNEFYNGGTDSNGNSGTNYGVSFSSVSLGLVDSDAGGNGNIANEPTPDTGLFFLSGGAATMNVAAGFDTGFSFFYSTFLSGFVNVYDDLNGTGNLLATIALTATNASCSGDPTGQYCEFSPVGVTFAGVAKSVDFGGTANGIVFDDITLGTSRPGNDVPEPASIALFGLAGACMMASRRKLRARRA